MKTKISNTLKAGWKMALGVLSKGEIALVKEEIALVLEYGDGDRGYGGIYFEEDFLGCPEVDDPVSAILRYGDDLPVILLSSELEKLLQYEREAWLVYSVACALLFAQDSSFTTDRAIDRNAAWGLAVSWSTDRDLGKSVRAFAAQHLLEELEEHRSQLSAARESLNYLTA